MSGHDAFERILTSLHEAMLDDVHWPTSTALIDEACGLTNNALLVGEGPKDDLRVLFVGLYYRGQRCEDLEAKYLEVYHPIDERVPRLRGVPHRRHVLFHLHVLAQWRWRGAAPRSRPAARRPGRAEARTEDRHDDVEEESRVMNQEP